MKKYLVEIIFYFLLPLAVILIVAEYSIRKIPNDYAYKSDWLTQNAQDIKILCLGPSSINYDINPLFFDAKGFNAAHVSQTIKYDHFILDKYISRMDSLRYLIIGIDYWSPYGSMEETAEWWRLKYYSIHYGCKYHKGEAKYNYELYFHKLENFKIALNGLLTLLGLRNETHRTVNDLGWGENYTLSDRTTEWDNGIPEALRHNRMLEESLHPNLLEENRGYLADICRKSEQRGIQVLLVNTPLYKSYYDNLNPRFVKERKDFCDSFVSRFNNVEHLDFTNDSRFSADDFYDSNHLNEIGTKKFTRILNDIILGK